MDSISLILLVVSLALGQETIGLEEQKNFIKRAKIVSCMNLVKVKFNRDYEALKNIIQDSQIDQETTVNKIVADIVIYCYQNIRDEQAREISILNLDAIQLELYEELLQFDQYQFQISDSGKLTPQQELIYKEIKDEMEKLKSEETEKQKKEEGALFSSLSTWTTFNKVVIAISIISILAGVLYFMVQKIQQPSLYQQVKKRQNKCKAK